MTDAAERLERDRPTPWVEPFAGMYWRIRVLQTLIGAALLIIFIQCYWVYTLSSEGAAHVYEVRDGETRFVADVAANLAPRPSEIRHFARIFIEHLRSLNSTTIHEDAATVVSLCDSALAERLQQEIAGAQIISAVRQRRIRSELVVDTVEILKSTRHYAKVVVVGYVHIYPLDRFEGTATEVRPFAQELTLRVGRRRPERPSGLSVSNISTRPTPQDPETLER